MQSNKISAFMVFIITAIMIVITGCGTYMEYNDDSGNAQEVIHSEGLSDDSANALSHVDPNNVIGIVSLNVDNLSNEIRYYKDAFNLNVLSNTNNTATIGKNKPLIRLIEKHHIPDDNYKGPGLYHIGLSYTSRRDLAMTVKQVIDRLPGSYLGASNLTVTESFYFIDPENNNIELFYDVDKKMNGKTNQSIDMTKSNLDVNEFIRKYENDSAYSINDTVSVRHVHLKVSNLETAKDFYVNILGFDITAEDNYTLFVSAGGYHHNLAFNTLLSKDAAKRNESYGLDYFEIAIPLAYFNDMRNRLDKFQINYNVYERLILLRDPFGNMIHIIAR